MGSLTSWTTTGDYVNDAGTCPACLVPNSLFQNGQQQLLFSIKAFPKMWVVVPPGAISFSPFLVQIVTQPFSFGLSTLLSGDGDSQGWFQGLNLHFVHVWALLHEQFR